MFRSRSSSRRLILLSASLACAGWLTLNHSISASRDGSSPSPFHLISSGQNQSAWVTTSYNGCAARAASHRFHVLRALMPTHSTLAASLPADRSQRSSHRFLHCGQTNVYRDSPALFDHIIRRVIIPRDRYGRDQSSEWPTMLSRRFRCRSRDRPPFGSHDMRHVPRASSWWYIVRHGVLARLMVGWLLVVSW